MTRTPGDGRNDGPGQEKPIGQDRDDADIPATVHMADAAATVPTQPIPAAPLAGDISIHDVTPVRFGPFSWALYEWGLTPYVILITIYIFGPYFSDVVIGNPEEGQAAWGFINGVAGFGVAILAPILGAIADRGGARKPWLLVFLVIQAPAIALLWFAMPQDQAGDLGLSIAAITGLIILITMCFEFSSMFHNAMLPGIVQERKLGGLSGLGLALGNAGAVTLLFVMLYAFALPGTMDLSFLPEAPLLGLDRELYEPNRIVGPIVAIWMVIFTIPLFFFTPDAPKAPYGPAEAVRRGFRSLIGTLTKATHYRNIITYLVARMLYADGKTAILIFGGVYASGTFGWQLVDQVAYGITLSIFAVLGGLFGGILDDRAGSRRAILFTIGWTMVALLGAISITQTEIFFIPIADPGTPVWGGPVFQTLPELAYIGVGTTLAMSVTAAYASSRTMLARLAPRDMMSEFFGLYALSGKATAFLGPLTVGVATYVFSSQRIGLGSVLLLLGAGFVVMLFVREERAQRADP